MHKNDNNNKKICQKNWYVSLMIDGDFNKIHEYTATNKRRSRSIMPLWPTKFELFEFDRCESVVHIIENGREMKWNEKFAF